MSVQYSAIISRVRTQLIDIQAVARWTDQELLNWINDGERELVLVAPRVSAYTTVMKLAAGTRQSIPADGYMFLTCYRNMGADGATPGPAPVKEARVLLDTQYPTWHAMPAQLSPSAYVFDPSDPAAFYCFPPSDGNGHLEINYSRLPVDVADPHATLQVLDIYQTPLFDYAMHRATAKDSDFAAGAAVSAAYFASFSAVLQNLMKDPTTMNTVQGQV